MKGLLISSKEVISLIDVYLYLTQIVCVIRWSPKDLRKIGTLPSSVDGS